MEFCEFETERNLIVYATSGTKFLILELQIFIQFSHDFLFVRYFPLCSMCQISVFNIGFFGEMGVSHAIRTVIPDQRVQ